MTERVRQAHRMFEAFARGDRSSAEACLSDDLRFSSPYDVDLDRAGYFERCWPGAGAGQRFEFMRSIDTGEEVIVTYERVKADGSRGRNTEVLSFTGEQISRIEVYFGWNLT